MSKVVAVLCGVLMVVTPLTVQAQDLSYTHTNTCNMVLNDAVVDGSPDFVDPGDGLAYVDLTFNGNNNQTLNVVIDQLSSSVFRSTINGGSLVVQYKFKRQNDGAILIERMTTTYGGSSISDTDISGCAIEAEWLAGTPTAFDAFTPAGMSYNYNADFELEYQELFAGMQLDPGMTAGFSWACARASVALALSYIGLFTCASGILCVAAVIAHQIAVYNFAEACTK